MDLNGVRTTLTMTVPVQSLILPTASFSCVRKGFGMCLHPSCPHARTLALPISLVAITTGFSRCGKSLLFVILQMCVGSSELVDSTYRY